MISTIETCLIWGKSHEANGYVRQDPSRAVVGYSSRTDCGYVIVGRTGETIRLLDDLQKSRLTTWLIDQNTLGVQRPEITETVIEHIKARHPIPVHERADRLLRFIAREGRTVADPVWINRDNYAAYAWSESTEWAEVDYCLDYLMQRGWLNGRESTQAGSLVTVSVGGYSRIAEKETNVDSSQAFVAMWFDESLKEAFDEGIEPAIREAGYKAMKIDQKPDVDKIDDDIIAELRRSRFLVADFTHGEKGARGGVYYEAGFAYGLDKPVIYTCRVDMVDNLHFDTRQYAHIVWKTPEELREGLKKRILARIGEGPGLHAGP